MSLFAKYVVYENLFQLVTYITLCGSLQNANVQTENLECCKANFYETNFYESGLKQCVEMCHQEPEL